MQSNRKNSFNALPLATLLLAAAVFGASLLSSGIFVYALLVFVLAGYLASLMIGEVFPSGFRPALFGFMGSVLLVVSAVNEEGRALAPIAFVTLTLVGLSKSFKRTRRNEKPCCH